MKRSIPVRRIPMIMTVLAVLISSAVVIYGQNNPNKELVRGTLSVAEAAAIEKGYKKTHDEIIDSLSEGAVNMVTFDLKGGVSYLVVGVCDADCGDIDFRVLDPEGVPVASDTEEDDVPVVELKPGKTGRYSVQVRMQKCSTSPCFYAIGVYGSSAEPEAKDGSNSQNVLERLTEQIELQLDSVGKVVLEEAGMSKTHNYLIDSLNKGDKDDVSLDLEKGRSYLLVGVCDEDCADLDIKVFDSEGNQVAADSKVDDVPAVLVVPASSGKFRIQITMVSCAMNPCFYGTGVFGR